MYDRRSNYAWRKVRLTRGAFPLETADGARWTCSARSPKRCSGERFRSQFLPQNGRARDRRLRAQHPGQKHPLGFQREDSNRRDCPVGEAEEHLIRAEQ